MQRRISVVTASATMAVVASAFIAGAGTKPVVTSAKVDTAKSTAVAVKKDSASVQNLKPQSTCPVMGGAINRKLFVDYQGKRIYVCCAGCIDALKKEPQKYIDMLAAKGESVESLPAVAPQQKSDTAAKSDATTKATSKMSNPKATHGDHAH